MHAELIIYVHELASLLLVGICTIMNSTQASMP